jgi:phage gp16-like protein
MRGSSITKPYRHGRPARPLVQQKQQEQTIMASNRNRSYKNPKHAARRHAAIGKIHIGKQQLGMDDETYRAMLLAIGGVRSAKDLTPEGISKVVQHLERAGATFTSPKRAGRRPHSIGSASERAAQLRKIEALLADAGRPYAYAASMARHMYKKDALEFCDGRELAGIIAGLAKNAQREGRLNTSPVNRDTYSIPSGREGK